MGDTRERGVKSNRDTITLSLKSKRQKVWYENREQRKVLREESGCANRKRRVGNMRKIKW